MDTELVELPNPEMRDLLIAGLANLVAKVGHERLVAQPILLPKSRYFPDPWNRSARGAYRVLRRLMLYAGLPGDARLHLFKTTRSDSYVDAAGDPYEDGPPHALATFHGKDEGQWVFGVDVAKLDDDETLVASLCHETAHAFRMQHGLEVGTSEIEEQLTDLTTVYLGFGVLTTSAAYRYRTTRTLRGHRIDTSRAGYLGPSALAFLLAVQAVVRKSGTKLARHLEANQAELFERAVHELQNGRDELLAQLGLPPEGDWPKPLALAPFLAPIDLANGDALDDEPPVAVEGRRNRGETVFRVPGRRGMPMALLGTVLMLVPALSLGTNEGNMAAVCLVGTVAGYLLGRRWVVYECSACTARVKRDDESCRRCDGWIAGAIADGTKRLEALEELEEGRFRSID